MPRRETERRRRRSPGSSSRSRWTPDLELPRAPPQISRKRGGPPDLYKHNQETAKQPSKPTQKQKKKLKKQKPPEGPTKPTGLEGHRSTEHRGSTMLEQPGGPTAQASKRGSLRASDQNRGSPIREVRSTVINFHYLCLLGH
ncbi:hypothetical protein SLEP1_g8065 [Rubroshorea leprosula]|uniref:Uncharacterized protein n=1 Tax=Rubroshorea leprosula TaxID=152421 RepID=A0AAV5IBH1_9ROSI|nr:hypothetical protein SLEP1_g8065 [Rubroshorea leprosula]